MNVKMREIKAQNANDILFQRLRNKILLLLFLKLFLHNKVYWILNINIISLYLSERNPTVWLMALPLNQPHIFLPLPPSSTPLWHLLLRVWSDETCNTKLQSNAVTVNNRKKRKSNTVTIAVNCYYSHRCRVVNCLPHIFT